MYKSIKDYLFNSFFDFTAIKLKHALAKVLFNKVSSKTLIEIFKILKLFK